MSSTSLEAKYQSSRRAATWLQDRLKELRAQASDAERAVVDYKANNNIVDTGGRLLNEQQLAELNSALTAAQATRSEAEARVQRVESILQAVDAKGISAETATVTDTLHNDVITRLRQQYLDLAERESDWAARYGPTHLAVVNLRNQMLEIRRSIADELKRIAETYRSDLDIAKSHEDTIKQDLANLVAQSNQTSQAQVTLARARRQRSELPRAHRQFPAALHGVGAAAVVPGDRVAPDHRSVAAAQSQQSRNSCW